LTALAHCAMTAMPLCALTAMPHCALNICLGDAGLSAEAATPGLQSAESSTSSLSSLEEPAQKAQPTARIIHRTRPGQVRAL
jgi:hypothetical protein